MKTTFAHLVIILSTVVLLPSCMAPRGVIESGRVAQKDELRIGGGLALNVPQAVVRENFLDLTEMGLGVEEGDTIQTDQAFYNMSEAIIALSIDPIAANPQFFLRHGFAENFDFGYKYTSGSHAVDVQYQWLGEKASNLVTLPGMHSSLAVQFSGSKFRFPGLIGGVQELLGYEYGRKDLQVKLIGSVPFGEDERYGHFGFGLSYNHAFFRYGFRPSQPLQDIRNAGIDPVDKIIESIEGKMNYGSYGGFVNFRVGYKFIYLYGAMGVYWQRFPSISYLGQEFASIRAGSVITNVGLQFQI